jgi:hypothetical protein
MPASVLLSATAGKCGVELTLPGALLGERQATSAPKFTKFWTAQTRFLARLYKSPLVTIAAIRCSHLHPQPSFSPLAPEHRAPLGRVQWCMVKTLTQSHCTALRTALRRRSRVVEPSALVMSVEELSQICAPVCACVRESGLRHRFNATMFKSRVPNLYIPKVLRRPSPSEKGLQAGLITASLSLSLPQCNSHGMYERRGACPAGGCILALCCDERVMTDDSASCIGLNEVALGIAVPRCVLVHTRRAYCSE